MKRALTTNRFRTLLVLFALAFAASLQAQSECNLPDVDCDGSVSLSDLLVFLQFNGTSIDAMDNSVCTYPDVNCDNEVNVSDLLGILAFYGIGDADGDGVLDSFDDCVLDECGICNGFGPQALAIDTIFWDIDSTYSEVLEEWVIEEVADTIFTLVCQNPGCMDTDATNFNPYASFEDGSCSFLPGPSECGGQSHFYYDGTYYDLVAIGDDCWFADNLATNKFKNGDPIPFFDGNAYSEVDIQSLSWYGLALIDGEPITSGVEPFQTFYQFDSLYNFQHFGRLFNLFAIRDPRGLCPTGWSLPSYDEYQALEEYSNTFGQYGYTSLLATSEDYPASTEGTNETGFTALGTDQEPYNWSWLDSIGAIDACWALLPTDSVGYMGGYWRNYFFTLYGSFDSTYPDTGIPVNPFHFFAVRCIRDTTDAPLEGCTDMEALNFQYHATEDDGSCVYTRSGCADLDHVSYQGTDYPLVSIANRCWFAKNLEAHEYANGDSISQTADLSEWLALGEGGCTESPIPFGEHRPYGLLYNGHAVQDSRGLCPMGWRIPSVADFNTLINVTSGVIDTVIVAWPGNSSLQHRPALNASPTDWPPGLGNNELGLSLAGSGDFPTTEFSEYTNPLFYSRHWTSEVSDYSADELRVFSNYQFSYAPNLVGHPVDHGASVRCVKDEPISGCTDADAPNYNPVAVIDDGSCTNLTATSGCENISTFYYDGHAYNLTQIGDQCWFAENLRATIYANGDPIPADLSDEQWSTTASGASAIYEESGDNVDFNLQAYGRLYNQAARLDPRGLCPPGTYIASEDDWIALETALGPIETGPGINTSGWRAHPLGSKLKASDGDPFTWDGTNESGFGALPAGIRDENGNYMGLNVYVSFGARVLHTSTDAIWKPESCSYQYSPCYENLEEFNSPQVGTSVRCIVGQQVIVPTVSTLHPENINDDSVELLGAIEDNTSGILTKGFIWSENPDLSAPTQAILAGSSDSFSLDVQGIDEGTNIYVCAFASNIHGTGYGDTLLVTVLNCSPAVFDDYTYQTVRIGNQCWFSENLRSQHYASGDAIPSGMTNEEWTTTSIGASSILNEGSASEATNLYQFGRLYNGLAVRDPRGVCPSGWTVPGTSDFDELTQALPDPDEAGLHLKASENDSIPWDGLNSVGFTALPGGRRSGSTYSNYCYFWTSNEPGFYGKRIGTASNSNFYSGTNENAHNGLSIRCLKVAAPHPTTLPPSQVTNNSAVLLGRVEHFGGIAEESGFVWSSDPAFSESTTVSIMASAGDTLSFELDGLSSGDSIYYKTYASNANGTSYGDVLAFVAFNCEPPTFDGYTYDVVAIGFNCWFQENLKTATYANGDSISSVADAVTWAETAAGAYVEGDYSTCLGDGDKLYNAFAVLDDRNVCPTGWHVSSDQDWLALESFIGLPVDELEDFGPRGSEEGIALKANILDTPSNSGTNAFGLSLVTNPMIRPDGGCTSSGGASQLWTSGSSFFGQLVSRKVNSTIERNVLVGPGTALGIRCVKNRTAPATVETLEPTYFTENAITMKGHVSPNEGPLAERGFFWWTSDSNGTEVVVNGGYDFQADLTEVADGDTLHYQAFAVASEGIITGDTITAVIPLCSPVSFGGITYNAVPLGDQCWFTENLRTRTYANGDSLPVAAFGSGMGTLALNNTDIANDTVDSPYGYLYSGHAVFDTRGLCPSGWRVPTEDDWQVLEAFFGMEADQLQQTSWRNMYAYDLRATPDDLPEWAGLISNAFRALPGETISPNGQISKPGSGYYWSKSAGSWGEAWFRGFRATSSHINRGDADLGWGMSVRCMKGYNLEVGVEVEETVETAPASEISAVSATLNGFVSTESGPAGAGFLWGSAPNELTNATESLTNIEGGHFSTTIALPTSGAFVYFTAFVDDGEQLLTGDTLSFAGVDCFAPEYFDHQYDVVQIDGHCWFAENLRTAQYANGDSLLSNLPDSLWAITGAGAQSVYGENPSGGPNVSEIVEQYGRIYNRFAINDERGLCPTGWRVPEQSDWQALANAISVTSAPASLVKASNNDDPPWNGMNLLGFSAAPAGGRRNTGEYFGLGDNALFNLPTYRAAELTSGATNFGFPYTGSGHYGAAVRCMYDLGVPDVTTLHATDVTGTSATLLGTSTVVPGTIVSRGVIWSYNSDLSDATVEDLTPVETNFAFNLEGNTPLDTVYYMAFVENALGTGYGDTLSVVFMDCSQLEYLGHTYALIQQGNQCLFAENLRATHYADGSPIPSGLSVAEWTATSEGASAVYGEGDGITVEGSGDVTANLADYGLLYNWYAVNDERGLCPQGWTVLSAAAYHEFVDDLVPSTELGPVLRENWGNEGNWGGSNATGFSARPGGIRSFGSGYFSGEGDTQFLWLSDEASPSTGRSVRLIGQNDNVLEFNTPKRLGAAVRCIQE